MTVKKKIKAQMKSKAKKKPASVPASSAEKPAQAAPTHEEVESELRDPAGDQVEERKQLIADMRAGTGDGSRGKGAVCRYCGEPAPTPKAGEPYVPVCGRPECSTGVPEFKRGQRVQ